MSIYASLPAPCEYPDDPYFKGRPVPIVYQGSHVVPGLEDDRGGWVDIALIPSHITRDGKDDGPDDGVPYPFLRLGVNNETVVLTYQGVEMVHRTLSEWLEKFG